MVQTQGLMSKIRTRRWSKEEYLLRQTKHESDIDPNDQSDFWGSFSDRDMHHKRTRKMGTQKHLRKSWYHHIECPAANFLAAFMWKKLMNSVVLSIATHKKLENVSDVTNTQVVAQMINKYRIKMIQNVLYNVRNPPWGGGGKREREHYSNQNCTCSMFNWFIWNLSSRTMNSFNSVFSVLAWSSSESILAFV